MGVFDFVKDAGARVGIGESTEEEARKEAEAEEARDAEREQRAKEVQEKLKKNREAAAKEAKRAELREKIDEAKKAQGLERYVENLGLEVEDLDVRYDDGKAQVTGKVSDQATRERVILALGNAEGVEQVEDAIEVAETAPEEESQMHAVVRGDTLWKIAEQYYGDGSRYPEIFEANKPMLKDPNKIYVGQVLRIPKG